MDRSRRALRRLGVLMLPTRMKPGLALTAGIIASLTGLAGSATASGAVVWSRPQLIANPSRSQPWGLDPAAVSCPSASLCLFAGKDRLRLPDQIDVVRDPWGPHPSQSVLSPRLGEGIDAVACPSSSLCVALDDSGSTGDPATDYENPGLQVLTSTNPAGGATTWSSGDAGAPGGFYGRGPIPLSCPSTALCVAGGSDTDLHTSTDPAGGFSTWVTTSLPSHLEVLTCPSTSLCVGVDTAGNVLTSGNPGAGASTWTASGAPALGTVMSLSCPAPSLCVAADDHGQALTSTDPSSSMPWQSASIDPGVRRVINLACPSTSLCLAADRQGNLWTSVNPASGPWILNHISAKMVGPLSCPTVSLCASAGGPQCATGERCGPASGLTSSNPTGGQADWSALPFPFYTPLTALSCPAASLCVTVGGDDRVWTSTRPTGGAKFWKSTSPKRGLPANVTFSSVACASTSTCLAIVAGPGSPLDEPAHLFSFNPRGGAHAFRHIRDANPSAGGGPGQFQQFACLPGPVCAVQDAFGDVYSSRNPARPRSWKRDRSHRRFFGVACPTQRFCAGIQGPSAIGVSTGGPYQIAATDTGNTLTGIACRSRSLCLATDDGGNVVFSANAGAMWTSQHIDDWGLNAIRCPSVKFCLAIDAGGRLLVGR